MATHYESLPEVARIDTDRFDNRDAFSFLVGMKSLSLLLRRKLRGLGDLAQFVFQPRHCGIFFIISSL
jgi:hypothetical protein